METLEAADKQVKLAVRKIAGGLPPGVTAAVGYEPPFTMITPNGNGFHFAVALRFEGEEFRVVTGNLTWNPAEWSGQLEHIGLSVLFHAATFYEARKRIVAAPAAFLDRPDLRVNRGDEG